MHRLSPLRQKLIGNTGWLFADQALRLALGLVVGVWVSRYLGPAQFGLYSYLLAIVALLAPLATLGLDQIVVRELVDTPGANRRLLGTAFALKLGGGAAVFALALLVISMLHPQGRSEQALIAIIAAGSIVQALDVCDLWFRAQTLARYTVYARGVAFITCALLRVALILNQAPLVSFVAVTLLEITLSSVGSVLLYWRKAMPPTAWQPHLPTARRLLAASWPLLFSGFAIMIYLKIDLIMLTTIHGEAAAGIYAAATRLSEVWYFIPVTILTSVSPTIVAARQEDPARYYRRLEQVSTFLARIALALALPIALLAEPLIRLVFGAAYSTAAPVLAVHIWAAIFVFLGVAQSPWDVAEDLTRLALFRTVGGAVINIGLNLLLIPAFAAVGAAVATAISYACSGWLLNAVHPRSRPFFLLQTRALIPWPGRRRSL